MIYADKDFYFNLISAHRAGDDAARNTLVWDKTADILGKQKSDVLTILNNNGIAVASNVSKKDLVNILTDAMKNNKNVQTQMARLIAYSEGFRFKKSAADGSTEGGEAQMMISSAISQAFNTDAASLNTAKNTLSEGVDTANKTAAASSSSNAGLKVLGAVAGVSLLIYLLIKE